MSHCYREMPSCGIGIENETKQRKNAPVLDVLLFKGGDNAL